MVAGSGRLDTRLMAHFRERLFCKVGAEGVYCAALPTLGLGLALKMDDGNNARAAEVVLAALLHNLLRTEDEDEVLLQGLRDNPIVNWNGLEVGRLRAAAPLNRPS
jgi:L-asparaginase II